MPVSTAMKTHLALYCTTLCTLWKVTAKDGLVVRVCAHSRDVTYNSESYTAVPLQPTQLSTKIGPSADNTEITAVLASGAFTEADFLAGRWDGARVEMNVINYLDPSMGYARKMAGYFGEVTCKAGVFTAEIRSLSEVLSQEVGDLTSPKCRVRKLGDTQCTISLTSFTHGVTVSAVTNNRQFTISGSWSNAYFEYGVITFTSGQNAGYSMEVRRNTGGALELALPFTRAVTIGDAATIIAGCNRSRNTCKTKFNNVVNFRGEPDLPGYEKAIRIPTDESRTTYDLSRGSGGGTAFPSPKTLTATVTSTTSIRLDWMGNSTTNTGVEVWRNGVLLATLAATIITFSDTGLSQNTEYRYEVRNVYGSDFSPFSNVATATTTVTAAAPSNLTAAAAPTQVALNWVRNATNNTDVELFRNGTLYQTLAASAITYTDTGVSSSQTYRYEVRNKFAGPVYSDFSNAAYAFIPLSSYPAPSSLGASNVTNESAALSWTRNTTANISVVLEKDGEFLVELPAATTGITVGSLAANTSYLFRVKNVYPGAVSSAYSNEIAVTTAAAAATLPAPSGLQATSITPTSVALAWTRNTGTNTGAELYRNGLLLASLGASVTSYTDTAVAANTTYSYFVRNISTSAPFASDPSNVVTISTVTNFQPPITTAVDYISGADPYVRVKATVNGDTINVFSVQMIRNGVPVMRIGNIISSWATGERDYWIEPNTQYQYGTRYVFNSGASYSDVSNLISVTTGNFTARPKPSGLSANVISATRIDLNWTRGGVSNGGVTVRRYGPNPPGNEEFGAALAASATSYSDTTNLQPHSTYVYMIFETYATSPNNSPAVFVVATTP